MEKASLKRWIFGFGAGNYETLMKSLKLGVHETSAHNLYLRLFVENGILGLSFFLLFVLAIFRHLYSFVKNKKDFYSKSLGILLMALISGTLLGASFFIDTLHWRHLWFTLGMAMALPTTP